VVRVLPDARSLDKAFDYLVPEDLAARVRVGTMVRVPLHGRRVRGWVVEDEVSPPDGVRLLALAGVAGEGPPAELVELAAWAAFRWAGPRAAFLRTASPPTLVRGLPPRPPSASPGEAPSELLDEVVRAGRAVVRLPPAADPLDLVAAMAARGAVLVVTASLASAADVVDRLRRLGATVAHVPAEWARAAAGGCTVVGARAAAWAPVPALAGAVVVDAHDEALQEERAPTWSAWRVAAERAARAGVPCALVSSCPTPEHLAWGRLITLSRNVERAGWPPVVVVDRRREDPRAGLYSGRLVDLLRRGGPVACVLNRRGRARLLACAACGELTRCEACGGAVQQGDAATLSCGRCGLVRPLVCQTCGAQRLKTLRVGISRAAEELAALAGTEVGEVSAATERVPDRRVLVGTEALLHRLPARWHGGAVAFLDFDQELLAPRFRAGEQALALLARAARAVGPRDAGGQVLVQTRVPGHEVLAGAVHADPGRSSGPEAARRAELRLPPAVALALVSGPGAAELVAALPGTVEVLGPDGNRFLVRAPDHQILSSAFATTPRPSARVRIEVDPARV
jgi:primosomal protein N' (replication factor Y) (superfamily II helicase)